MQGFLARLIEKEDLKAADRSRGRFRSFLQAGLANFLANLRDRDGAERRGGSLARFSIDRAAAERPVADGLAVELGGSAVDREWARELLGRSLAALRRNGDAPGSASSSRG